MRQTLCSLEETALGQKNATMEQERKMEKLGLRPTSNSSERTSQSGAVLPDGQLLVAEEVCMRPHSLTHSCRPPTDYGLSDIGGIGCQSQVGELPR